MGLYRTREGHLVEWPGDPGQAARLGWRPDGDSEPAYADLPKAELQRLAAERGVDSDGTKADIAARLSEQGEP